MRKLASVQKISNIFSIEGKDRIVQLQILGWSLVSQKDNFKVGDICVMFEVDSILPNKEWCAFLEDNKRIKTRRFGGIVSQGLALPIKNIPILDDYITELINSDPNFEIEGLDVTTLLGVTKYDPPLDTEGGFNSGNSKGNFPIEIPKTDETRVQSIPFILNELKDKPYYIALKYDGTSATYLMSNEGLVSCSRNHKKDEESLYHKVGLQYNLDKLLPKHLAIQGEICGPKIQSNKLKLEDFRLFIFNIFNIESGTYLDYDDFVNISNELGLNTVEILEQGDKFNYNINELIELSKGLYTGTNNPREGIVIRPKKEEISFKAQARLSFKVINPDFCLKYGY